MNGLPRDSSVALLKFSDVRAKSRLYEWYNVQKAEIILAHSIAIMGYGTRVFANL